MHASTEPHIFIVVISVAAHFHQSVAAPALLFILHSSS